MLISSVFAVINGMGTVPYPMSKAADVVPGPLSFTLDGLRFEIRTPQGIVRVNARLVGKAAPDLLQVRVEDIDAAPRVSDRNVDQLGPEYISQDWSEPEERGARSLPELAEALRLELSSA